MIVQPGGVYGPGDTSSIGELLSQFLAGKMPLIPFPELGICLSHVEDIAAGILLGLDKGKPGEAYVISGPATTVREAIETVAEVTGSKAPKHAIPVPADEGDDPDRAAGREDDGPAAEPARADLLRRRRHLLGQLRQGHKASSATNRAGSKRACGRRSRPKANCPPPARVCSEHRLPPMRVIDVEHLGRPHVIGCWEVDGALVDPGPESSLQTLLEKLGDEQPRAILLTHIHLDHAAATGAMVRRWPDLEVYVHERGAPHLIDPSQACWPAPSASTATRCEYLWGEIVPVPEANVTTLSGGETVLGMRVAYTPGHASHHVCYLHEDSGTAFVGDVAAVRIPPLEPGRPPDPAAGHRRRDLGGVDRDRRRLGASDASPSPTSARSRSRRSTWRSSASACARRPQLARDLSEAEYEQRPPRPDRRQPSTRRPPPS